MNFNFDWMVKDLQPFLSKRILITEMDTGKCGNPSIDVMVRTMYTEVFKFKEKDLKPELYVH